MVLKPWSETERNGLHTWLYCRLSSARWANHSAWLLQDISSRIDILWDTKQIEDSFLLSLSVHSLNPRCLWLSAIVFSISGGTMKIKYESVHTFQSGMKKLNLI